MLATCTDVLSLGYCQQVRIGLLGQINILLLLLFLYRFCFLGHRLFMFRLVDFLVFLYWLWFFRLSYDRLFDFSWSYCLWIVFRHRHFLCNNRHLLLWLLLFYIEQDEQKHACCHSNC